MEDITTDDNEATIEALEEKVDFISNLHIVFCLFVRSSNCLSVQVSVFLSVCLSVCLPACPLSVCSSKFLSVSVSVIYPNVL